MLVFSFYPEESLPIHGTVLMRKRGRRRYLRILKKDGNVWINSVKGVREVVLCTPMIDTKQSEKFAKSFKWRSKVEKAKLTMKVEKGGKSGPYRTGFAKSRLPGAGDPN